MDTETQTPEVAHKTDFSKTNIHCSAIGVIMTGDRGKTPEQRWKEAVDKYTEAKNKYDSSDELWKETPPGKKAHGRVVKLRGISLELEVNKNNPPLSVTAKTHLKTVYGYEKYGKWAACKDKGNKYTNKGQLAEQDSIGLVCRVRNINLQKNEERINNEFLTGIPDLFLGKSIYQADYIIDIKTSWDIETFLSNIGKPLDTAYWYQIQGYMAITGALVGEVAYCLVNTPQSILNNELYRLKERMDVVTDEAPEFLHEKERLINNMTFDDMPDNDKVIRFLVERDDAVIESIYKRVVKCREYLSEIEQLHKQGVFLAKESKEIEETDNILVNDVE